VKLIEFFLYRDSLKPSPDLIQRIYEHILKECKKDSLPYRSIAIRVLSIFAEEYNFQIYELFWTWFEKAFKQPVNNLLSFINILLNTFFRIQMRRR
jgi:hypothetical protein